MIASHLRGASFAFPGRHLGKNTSYYLPNVLCVWVNVCECVCVFITGPFVPGSTVAVTGSELRK